MRTQVFKRAFFLLILAGLLPLATCRAQGGMGVSEKRITVTMRTIGHEVLLCLGDQESRVLPIEPIAKQGLAPSYRISFAAAFAFEPSDIATTVDRIMTETGISTHYFVEVEQCNTKEVVHSFEMNRSIDPAMVTCGGRMMSKDCYSLVVTLLDDLPLFADVQAGTSEHSSLTASTTWKANLFKSVLVMIGMLSLAGLVGFLLTKKEPVASDPHLVQIGASQFDKKRRALSFEDQQVELSHKEAELLALLHTSANQPLERALILQKVWGDEGDYIGRTLDVFISKLRKKLEADTSVKIINIRGVGYQLVMDV